MGRHKIYREKFIELANKEFTDKDVFVKISYRDKYPDCMGILKDILRFLKMPFKYKYEPTFDLEVQKELVKMIYFKEISCSKVFWFLINKDFACGY